ncbi:MAG TPA: pyridoxamine 5'-phosphate oxidase family protein [Geodermatophilus sp.]|jgi:nitroimidazol reductase NimA-like FMN-containing flavoprotein (pyridoxamine 5'-phosphate oxidase superfamily)|nr:pyridoxamine 5'-phosphate oxidase family protein [Geodermatophilus sp.]
MPTTDPDRIVVPLDDAECRALLLGGRIGRLAFTRHALPAIQPVSYRLHDGEVVIPALAGSPFLPSAGGAVVAFEVDAHDEDTRTGWSVTVVGPCRTIARPAEVAVCHALPWGPDAATTPDRRYVAVRIGLLSGWRTELRGA